MLFIVREEYVSVIGINIQYDPKNWTKINDYNIKINWYKKVKEYRELTRDLLQQLEEYMVFIHLKEKLDLGLLYE